MSQLYQLAYASQSNVSLGDKGINLEIGRILTKSKNNNSKKAIGGVLYYADGHFFQVLEGDKEAIESLFEKVCLDVRHSDAKIVFEGYVDAPQFTDWSMHFVSADSSIRQLFKDNGFAKFTPFSFPESLIKTLILVLSNNGKYIRSDSVKTKNPLSSFLSMLKGLFAKKKTV